MNRVEQANTYHDSGYNCCQAVVASFSDCTGLPAEQSLAIGGGFGGGLRCGEICGAVSGAVMVLSMTHPYRDNQNLDSKNRIAFLTKEFHRRFKENFSCERCIDLLQADISESAAMQRAKETGAMKRCPLFIGTAVSIVEAMLKEEANGTL